MPSASDSVSIPGAGATVARRYHRRERALTAGLTLLIAAAVAIVMLAHSFLVGLFAGVIVVALLRIPVFETSGSARLRSEAAPTTVSAEFTSATPPVFVLQWGIADRVRPKETGAVYDISYLFGLRTARTEVTVTQRSRSNDGRTTDMTLTVSVDGHSWGTYTVSVEEDTADTLVIVDWRADRRFGLRWLSQWFLARSYRPAALTAQGYQVVEYEASLSL